VNANLHLHSKFSDGSLWPEDIVRGAARLGLDLIALTDHDTMGGSDRFAAECAAQGLSWVSACEIDVADPAVGYKSELLAYFPGKTPQDCAATGAMLQRVLDERRKRLDYYLYWARTFFKREDLTLEDMIARRKADDDAGGGDELPLLSWSKVDLFLYLRNNKLVPAYMNYKIFKKEWMRPGRFPNTSCPSRIRPLVSPRCMPTGDSPSFPISGIYGTTIPRKWNVNDRSSRLSWGILRGGAWMGWNCTGIRETKRPGLSTNWSAASPGRWGTFSPMARTVMVRIRTSILSINSPGISPVFPFRDDDRKPRLTQGV